MTEPVDWGAAVCRSVDPEMFFPPKGGVDLRVRRVCNGSPATAAREAIPPCPVREACLELGMKPIPGSEGELPQGIWGGLSQMERDRLRGRKRGYR